MPAGRVVAREVAGGLADEREDRRQGLAAPERGTLSAITAGCVSFVAMLAPAR